MSEPDHQPPEIAREEQARAYDSIHNRLFGLRILIYIGLITAYLFSGASAELAEGLRARFGEQWWWVNTFYLLVTFFAFAALLFPLSVYSGHTLEHRYGLSRQSFSEWMVDYLKELGLELVLGTLLLSIVYAFLHAVPDTWWIWAAVTYMAISVLMSAVWPVWIMPLFHDFEELRESELTAAVRRFAEKSGIEVLGVFKWGLADKTDTANAALTGLGRTRRIILADTMLDRYEQQEIIAVIAHEVGHFKHLDLWRLLSVGAITATVGFYLADWVLQAGVQQFGFAAIGDIGAFPIFMFALFIYSLISMPFSNAYSRRREYAADAYAVQSVGEAAPLISALEKLADQNLSDKEPPAWIEFLLHSHPSIRRRIDHAKRILP